MRSPELINIDRAEKRSAVSGVLTLSEAAAEMRCSKAHLSNILCGKVSGLPTLPVMRVGRRVLIRHAALMKWMLSIETNETMGADLNSSLATHRKA
jgi:hypothetical protein